MEATGETVTAMRTPGVAARLALLAIAMQSATSQAATHDACAGRFAHPDATLDDAVIASPDGAHTLRWDQQQLALLHGARGRADQRIDTVSFPQLTEVLWSPDSRRVAVTGSEGGEVGTWSTVIHRVDARGALHAEPIRLALDTLPTLGHLLDPADAPGHVNLAVVAWLDGGRSVLIVEEVPPHSYYTNLGALRGHVYDVARRRVIAVLDEPELRRRHGARLGCRLRAP